MKRRVGRGGGSTDADDLKGLEPIPTTSNTTWHTTPIQRLNPQVLENLKNRAEELVRQHVPEELALSLLKPARPSMAPSSTSRPLNLGMAPMSAAALEDGTTFGRSTEPDLFGPGGAAGSVGGGGGLGSSGGGGDLGGGLSRRGRLPGADDDLSAGSGGGGGGLSRRGWLPSGGGGAGGSMTAFARARSMARTLSLGTQHQQESIPEHGSVHAGGASAATNGGGAVGGGGSRRMLLSSLSMPIRGASRAAAAMEGIAKAAVIEDGEGLGVLLCFRRVLGGWGGESRAPHAAGAVVVQHSNPAESPTKPSTQPHHQPNFTASGNEWGLTLQQQRIVADLMRLRQLVHKAVSKMDQRWVGWFGWVGWVGWVACVLCLLLSLPLAPCQHPKIVMSTICTHLNATQHTPNPTPNPRPNNSRLEALLFAAASGDADAVQGLLRQGMSPDSANAEGTTPLILAASKGHNVSAAPGVWGVGGFRLAKNDLPQVSWPPPSPTNPPLNHASMQPHTHTNRSHTRTHTHTHTHQCNHTHTQQPHTHTNRSHTRTHTHTHTHAQEVVLSLLFLGADPSKCDASGRSPLLLACQHNHDAVVDVLMRYGAKLGMEPVMLVGRWGGGWGGGGLPWVWGVGGEVRVGVLGGCCCGWWKG